MLDESHSARVGITQSVTSLAISKKARGSSSSSGWCRKAWWSVS